MPSAWQVLILVVVESEYPGLQEYIADQPQFVPPFRLALPFAMVGGGPQSTRVQVGCKPLQVPLAWQVRVEAPARE